MELDIIGEKLKKLPKKELMMLELNAIVLTIGGSKLHDSDSVTFRKQPTEQLCNGIRLLSVRHMRQFLRYKFN